MILATGIFLTIRLKGIQVRKLILAFKYMFSNETDGEHGEISSFGALCTALSATIGTGNIVGVATAIVAGGPGALFWMIVAATVGTATKYSECLLAIKYRTVADDGHIVGGPFYYIEKGMGENWKWLAKIFAVFGVMVGLLGIGTFSQINGITSAVNNFFDANNAWTVQLFGRDYSWTVVIAGIILTIFVAFVIIGGLRRISAVAQVVVPFMAAAYIIAAVVILILNYKAIPGAVVEIVQSAFGMRAVAGGALGAMMLAMQKGIARGIFSNEAGIGSAPIAAAAVQTTEPVRQGLVSMLGTVIDTIIICTCTAMIMLLAPQELTEGLTGMELLQTAMGYHMGRFGVIFIAVTLFLFSFSTFLGILFYARSNVAYLFGDKWCWQTAYKVLALIMLFIGGIAAYTFVWDLGDVGIGLMTIFNVVFLYLLADEAIDELKDYEKSKKLKK